MVLVFCIIFGILLLFPALIFFSTLRIKINKFLLSNQNVEKIVRYDYEIQIQLCLFNSLPWITFKMDEKKMQKLKLEQKLKNIDFKKWQKELPKKEEQKELLQLLKIEMKTFGLQLEIGTEDVIITSFLISILSSLLGIGLSKVIKRYNSRDYHFTILPIYHNENSIKLNLDCIIQVKMVHIINSVYVLLKKRRVEKHERTSDRRAYDYSYE